MLTLKMLRLMLFLAEMEPVGLAIGLVTLFRTCQEVIENIDTYKHSGPESRALKTRFDLNQKLFQSWAESVGISSAERKGSLHPLLDDPETASLVQRALVNIVENFHVTSSTSASAGSTPGALAPYFNRHNLLSSKKDRVKWALGGKTNFAKKVDDFQNLVADLRNLVPPPDELGTLSSNFDS